MKYMYLACSLLLIGGCANSFERARQAAADAPAWYDSAKKEIVGEGYPNLGSMPSLSEADLKGSTRSIRMSRQDLAKARELFTTHPRAMAPVTTEIEVRAFKSALVAKLARSGPAPTGTERDLFLKPSDIDRFRDTFERAEER